MRQACLALALLCSLSAGAVGAADYPAPVQGDYVIRDVTFAAGGRLSALKLHYRTIGQPRRDAAGRVVNAVLVLHGTTGSGAQFIRPEFAGDLVNPPELGILERETTRVPRGRAVVMPASEQTRGHGSHTIAALWKHLLAEILTSSGGGA